ncbi:MAG: hypothetical protein HY560_10260 [Gemmatimonadetes bacterium]|nr:hypothetical protein [Gemmatimonadota bacterium]
MTARRSQFNRLPRRLLAVLFLCGGASRLAAECAGVKGGRVGIIAGGYLLGETVALATQHREWWPNPSRSWHFIWAGSPSKGQDALLHGWVAYQASQVAALAWDWACLSRSAAGWLGAATGVAIAIPKEIGDAFHNGFSGPDLLWTGLGASVPALHRAVPAARVVQLKLFYWPSAEYPQRVSLQSDYAGQRFYLSVNPARTTRLRWWPAWLGIAIGHGVPHWITVPPRHDWYLTLDLDFRGLPIRGRWWKKVAALLDQGHLPLPGLRIRSGTARGGLF